MKKAIVMEKHRQYTIVMTEDGMFHKAKPVKDANVGAKISYELIGEKKQFLFYFHPKKVNKPFRLIAMVCLILLIVMPFYFISDSNKTYAYVNVDINPSVELEIDEDLQVHSILPLNEDAKELVNALTDYQGDSLDEVLSRIMDKSEEKGLIKNGKNVLIGVSYVNKKTHEISVLETIDRYFLNHQTDWRTATFRVPKEIRENAKDEEKSMNELMAASLVGKTALSSAGKNKKNRMNDEEKAIIKSFYNNKDKMKETKTDRQKQNPTKKSVNEKNSNKKKHPSDQKRKNGEIHSNKENKGKSKIAKEKHKKDKQAKKNNQRDNNDNHKHDNRHKSKQDDRKHKHKHKQNHREKGNNEHHKQNHREKGKHEHHKQKHHEKGNNGHHKHKHEHK